MKYAAVALLVASAEAAQYTGCLKGIKTKVYSDSKCKTDAHTEIAAMSDDLENTGKCNKHVPEQAELDALKSAEDNLAAHKVEAAKIKRNFERADTEDITDGVTPAEHYTDEYPLVKKAWVKSHESNE